VTNEVLYDRAFTRKFALRHDCLLYEYMSRVVLEMNGRKVKMISLKRALILADELINSSARP
jgi:hypothetical protein